MRISKQQDFAHIKILMCGRELENPFLNLIEAFCSYQNLNLEFEFDSKEVLKYSKGRSKTGILFQDKFYDNFFSFVRDFEESGLVLC